MQEHHADFHCQRLFKDPFDEIVSAAAGMYMNLAALGDESLRISLLVHQSSRERGILPKASQEVYRAAQARDEGALLTPDEPRISDDLFEADRTHYPISSDSQSDNLPRHHKESREPLYSRDSYEPGAKRKTAERRKGVWTCCVAITLCLVAELVLLVWALKSSVGGYGSGLLYEGSCDRAKNLAIWLLLPLNIAATVLISASNYVIQIIAAPSRSEIDHNHRFGRASVVCGMSFRVLASGRGSRMRRTIWWLLILSSLPIHLLLNSAIYSSVQASDNGILVLSDTFESESPWTKCNTNFITSSPSANFTCHILQYFVAGETKELSRAECVSQYSSAFQTNASSVIVVVDENAGTWYNPPQNSVKVPDSYGIACAFTNSGYVQVADSDRHYVFNYDETSGSLDVSFPYLTGCRRVDDGTQNSSSIRPGNSFSAHQSSGAFFYAANDTLSNITSVKSVFSAISYRYWATAQVTGDYLNAKYQELSTGWDTRSWLCSGNDFATHSLCNSAKILTGSEWKITPSALPVSKCHVLPKEERCTVRYSWRILLITICCDLAKIVAVMLTLIHISEPLATIGDVIASFLQDPDPHTRDRCLLEDDEAKKWVNYWEEKRVALIAYLGYALPKHETRLTKRDVSWHDYSIPSPQLRTARAIQFREACRQWLIQGGPWWAHEDPVAKPKQWNTRSERWYFVPSTSRWMLFNVLYTSSTAAAIVYLSYGMRSLRSKRASNTWTVGFAGPDPNALFEGSILSSNANVTWAAVLINIPQVFFSMLYFIFNAVFTSMHTGQEWAEFAKHRKTLRLSSPRGNQRSTYWLQLPWKYSVPLTIASGLLHWLLGRSIYLVKVEIYGYFGERQADDDFFACGYNPITTLLLIMQLAIMLLTLLITALRRLTPGATLVRFNSLAIAAACHPDPSEKDVALKPLMWGILKDEEGHDTRHCSFSAKDVSPLREGMSYL